jgi:4a-hydroxytetrahydrobiopterin dehydratase
MGRPSPISIHEISKQLSGHPHWGVSESDETPGFARQLERTYSFPKFQSAIAFIQGTANWIDQQDHHPSWENTYNKVRVRLTTWDGGEGTMNKVTELDTKMACFLDDRAEAFGETTLDLEASRDDKVIRALAGRTNGATHKGDLRHPRSCGQLSGMVGARRPDRDRGRR